MRMIVNPCSGGRNNSQRANFRPFGFANPAGGYEGLGPQGPRLRRGVARAYQTIVMAAMALGLALAPGMPGSAAVDTPPGGGGGTAAIERSLATADGFFLTQYHHRRYNPDEAPVNNANCGPASLAMALRAFGRAPRGLSDSRHAAALIRYVRKVMTGDADERAWTYPSQVAHGARQMGLKSREIFTLPRILEAMATPGRMMVVNLNPTPAYANLLVMPYNGGHFALLTGVVGDRATLADPLAEHPITIGVQQLAKALTTPLGFDPDGRFVPPYDGGVLLWQ